MSRTALRAVHAAPDPTGWPPADRRVRRIPPGDPAVRTDRWPGHPGSMRPADRGVRRVPPADPAVGTDRWPGYARPVPDDAQLSAWRRRLELDDRVRAAAATVVESPMPQPAGPAGHAAVLRAAALVVAALAVAAGYIGLPLALAARTLLGALPQALVLATAIVVLGAVGVLTVLRRTALAVPTRGPGRRDSFRHGAGSERPSGRTAPPDRRALPHAGPTAPPHRRAALHGTPHPGPTAVPHRRAAVPPHPGPTAAPHRRAALTGPGPTSSHDLAPAVPAGSVPAPAAGRHRTAGARRSRHGARRR